MTKENVPVFRVLDTTSSHGRYSRHTKEISFDDLVKFHGHACDGLYRSTYALYAAFALLFPDGIIDRTDLRAVSRNSPCIGDAVSYLTGARVRFGTQNVSNEPGVWYILQKISSGKAVEVREEDGFFPRQISETEASLISSEPDELPGKLDQLKEMQDNWVRDVLLNTKPEEHYHAHEIEYTWQDVPFSNKGTRTDIIFKDVIQ